MMTNVRYHHINGAMVEVFPDPHAERTRDFANGVFAMHEKMYGQELNWDTPNGDRVANQLLKVMLDDQIAALTKWADEAWRDELKAIRAANAANPKGALGFLYGLAWDGGGWRPKGETFGWAERMEARA